MKNRPDTLFMFGDNMVRKGLGGQARIMRYKPNAVGVPTKMKPSTDPAAYFTDNHMRDPSVIKAVTDAFTKVIEHIKTGKDVVIPLVKFGSGLAMLDTHAPMLFKYIELWVKKLQDTAYKVKIIDSDFMDVE